MPEPKTLKDQFGAADQERGRLLELWRDYAILTIPDVLPRSQQAAHDEFPAAWRNIGGVGVENMVGRLLTSLFPVGLPWFAIEASAEVMADRALSEADKAAFGALLFQRELVIAAKLESTNYRTAARSALESLIVCGNTLLRAGPGYDVRYYRPDCWVVRRTAAGDVLWTITKEKKHPQELSAEARAKAEIKADDDQEHELFTRSRRVGQDEDWRWEITQEIGGKVANEQTVRHNPYNCVAYRLCPGEHYSRGFISTRFPDLKSINALWQALIFGLSNAAKMAPVIDPSETHMRPADLAKGNGVPIVGRVVNGVIQGAAFLQTNKTADFGIAFQGAQALEQSLGRDMLMETASMPKGERVTAYAVSRIARELEGALGSPYAQIASRLQLPLIEHCQRELERRAVLAPLPGGAATARVAIKTGAAALARELEFDNLMDALQIILSSPQLEQGAHLNYDAIVDRIFQLKGLDAGNLILSAEEVAAQMKQRMAEQIVPSAGQEAVRAMGDIMVARAKAQAG